MPTGLSNSFISLLRLYTYGSPRVGKEGFASKFTGNIGKENIYRCIHVNDPVTMVPIWPFMHVPFLGREFLLNSAQGSPQINAHFMSADDGGDPGYVRSSKKGDWGKIKTRKDDFYKNKTYLSYEDRVKTTRDERGLKKIISALLTLLRDANDPINNVNTYPIMARLQYGFASISHTLDVLARTLNKIANISKKFYSHTKGLLGHIIAFTGALALNVPEDITYTFVKMVFDRLAMTVRTKAQQALEVVGLQY